MHEQKRLPSIGTFFSEVVAMTKQKFTRFYKILAPVILLNILLAVISAIVTKSIGTAGVGFKIVTLIIQVLYMASTLVGATAVLLDFINSKKFSSHSVTELYSHVFKSFWKLVVAYLGVMLIMYGGCLLFGIPGIILSIISMFTLPIVAMEGVDFEEALGRSRALVYGYKWGVFGRSMLYGIIMGAIFLVLIGLTMFLFKASIAIGVIVGIISFVIAILLIPSMYAQIAVIYHHLKKVNGDNDPMPYKTWFLVLFIILGTLAFAGYSMLSAKSQKQYSAAMQQAQMQQLQMMQQGMQSPEGAQMTPEMQQAMNTLNAQMTQMQNMQKPQ